MQETFENITVSEVSLGASVLVEKVNEPFDAIRKAYESRIMAMTEIPKKLQEYPNPREEKVHLAVHQQKIRETQAMLEGMPQPILRGPIPFQPSLGMIPEVPSSVERESKQAATLVVVETQIQEEENVVQDLNDERPLTTAHFGDEIPEVEEMIAREMWDAIKQKMDDEALSYHTPPFSLVDFTGQPPIEAEAMTYWDDQGSEDSFPSKQTLRTMPSYLGDYEPKSMVMTVPSVWNNKKKEHDTANLHALMSAPITCTLPLTDVLKVKPDLWENVAKRLQDMGLWNDKLTMDKVLKTKIVVSRQICML